MDRPASGKFVRYLLAGGSAAVLDTLLFSALFALGVPVPIAAAISILLATFYNYWVAAPHVFGAARTATGFLRFLMAAMVGFSVNIGLTTWLPGPLAAALPPSLIAALPPLPIVAKLIAICVAFAINFSLNLFVVFRGTQMR